MRPVWSVVGECIAGHRNIQLLLSSITDSLGDGALGLGDPILVLGSGVVLGDFLVDQSLAEGLGRSPPVVHAGQTGLQDCGVGHGIGLSLSRDVILGEIGQGLVGRRDGTHLVMQLLGFGGAKVGCELSGGLGVLGVRIVGGGLGGREGLHLLLLAVHGEGRQLGGK